MLNLKKGSCILGAVLLLSSCVAEQSSIGINSPLASSQSNTLDAQTVSADGQIIYSNQTSADGEFISPYPPGSPIPIKAPRNVVQSATASTGTDASTATQQIQAYQTANKAQTNNAVTNQIVQNGQPLTPASSIAVPTQNPNKSSTQIANATTQSNTVSAPTLSTQQTQSQTSQVATLAPEISNQAPKSNLFATNANVTVSKKKNKTIRRGRGDDDGVISTTKKFKKQRLASLNSSASSVSTNTALSQTNRKYKNNRTSRELNTLPGVKSNNEIFGIEEHEDLADTQVAALSGLGRISPNGLRVQHEKVQVACLKQGVLQILKKVERRYGKKPIITSGYRDPKRNRRAGGARRSQHIYCKAVDIQVEGVSKWNLAKYLRTIPGRGGVGTYCRTKSVHIDIGSKRDWHSKCRRSSVKKRKKKKKT